MKQNKLKRDMIYDTFLFYNELELLEIRLNELDSVVDKFVLVEATVTHTNKPKPLYYQLNKHLFKKFSKKIIHIIVKDSPDVDMTWIIERYQLSAVTRGLVNCKPNDIILYSCLDEIPKAEKIIEWKDKPGRLKAFNQVLCLYYLNYYNPKEMSVEVTRMFRYKDLQYFKDIYLTIFLKPDVCIPDGGWHFSYMGGVRRIQEKLAAFAHQELNNDKYNTPEKIKLAIAERRDPFGLGWKFRVGDVNFLPKYVQLNKKRFADFIISSDEDNSNIKFMKTFWEIKHSLRVKFLRKFKRRIDSLRSTLK